LRIADTRNELTRKRDHRELEARINSAKADQKRPDATMPEGRRWQVDRGLNKKATNYSLLSTLEYGRQSREARDRWSFFISLSGEVDVD
jgi:hypothetical protein